MKIRPHLCKHTLVIILALAVLYPYYVIRSFEIENMKLVSTRATGEHACLLCVRVRVRLNCQFK